MGTGDKGPLFLLDPKKKDIHLTNNNKLNVASSLTKYYNNISITLPL